MNQMAKSRSKSCVQVIREIASLIKQPLTFILNKSFSTGNIPDKLKISVITPVYKQSGYELRILLPEVRIDIDGYNFHCYPGSRQNLVEIHKSAK